MNWREVGKRLISPGKAAIARTPPMQAPMPKYTPKKQARAINPKKRGEK
jgi:hypothetical protein